MRGVIKGANRSRVRPFILSFFLFFFAGREDTDDSSEVKDEDPSESTDVWKCASAIKLIGLFNYKHTHNCNCKTEH